MESAESRVSLDIQSNIQKKLFAWTEVGLDPPITKLETEASCYWVLCGLELGFNCLCINQ